MQTRRLLAAVVITLGLSSGCFTILDENGSFDLTNSHNAQIFDKWGSDLRAMHRDWDFIVHGIDNDAN